MTTTGTIATPEALTGQPNGARRAAPQPEAQSAAQRFAELLQRRRDAQPASPPARQPEARPESRAGSTPDRANGDGAAADKATGDAGAKPEASDGCRAAEQPVAKPPSRPGAKPRDLPVVDVPLLPPTIAPDIRPASDAASGDGAATGDGAAVADRSRRVDEEEASEQPRADLWPGMPLAAAGVAPQADATSAELRGGAAKVSPGIAGLTDGATAGAATGSADAGAATGRGEGDAQSDARSGAQFTLPSDAQAGANARAQDDSAATLLAASAANSAAPHGDVSRAAPAANDIVAMPWSAGNATHRAEGGAPVQAALATPPGTPDFARALGAQVSVFARNGLAHAELQLTPAEMGPIRVQIAIDGAHARVDFAADSAATRQAIERGLPELASALREQGLTLAGGGVFQRAPDQSEDNGTPKTERTVGRGRRRGAEAIAEPIRVRSAAVRPGGVDLYA